MDFDGLAAHLKQAFTIPRYSGPSWTVFVGPKTINLESVVRKFLESEAEREEIAEQGILELLEEEWVISTLMCFEWQSLGPMSTVDELLILDIGEPRVFVCVSQEEQPLRAVASIDPKDSPQAFSEFFRSVMHQNGELYGLELFGSLPSTTTNSRPDLIPQDVVKEAYWDWMEWAGSQSWVCLRDDLINGLLASNPMERALRALRSIPRIEHVKEWREARVVEEEELLESDRRLILENYFHTCYEENRDAELMALIASAPATPAPRTRQNEWVLPGSIHTVIPLDEDRIIVATSERTGVFYPESELVNWTWKYPTASATLSFDGARLALGRGRAIVLVDLESGAEARSVHAHRRGVERLTFDGKGRLLASAAKDGVVLWDVASLSPLQHFVHRAINPGQLALHPDGNLIVTTQFGGGLTIWDTRSGKRARRGETPSGWFVWNLAYSPDGQYLAVSAKDIFLYDPSGSTLTGTLELGPSEREEESGSWQLCFSLDGRLLATWNSGGKIIVFELKSKRRLWSVKGEKDSEDWIGARHEGLVSVGFTPSGRVIVAAMRSGRVRCHRL